MCILFDIEAPSLNEIILNAALALLFYVCGHGFLFQSCSIGNPQYAPEIGHQTPGTLCIKIVFAINFATVLSELADSITSFYSGFLHNYIIK
jgi:hypothetical protein